MGASEKFFELTLNRANVDFLHLYDINVGLLAQEPTFVDKMVIAFLILDPIDQSIPENFVKVGLLPQNLNLFVQIQPNCFFLRL